MTDPVKGNISQPQPVVAANSAKAWLLAARPKTLTGAAVPVMIGIAFALRLGGWDSFRLLPAVLCFLFAFIMQIDANFINDYFDCLRGNDDATTRLGPKRACSEGWITLPAMRAGIVVTTALACLTGLPLIVYGGWEMIVVGLVCVAFCFLYTTRLSYLGLGDLLVLVFFGIVPVCLTCYVVLPEGAERIDWHVFSVSVWCGLVIDTLLVVNNYRDRENDCRDGKMTLVVRIGEKYAERLYLGLGLAAVLGVQLTVWDGNRQWTDFVAFFLPDVYLFLHVLTYQQMIRIRKGRELNKILGQTARNMFVFGIVTTLGLLMAS